MAKSYLVKWTPTSRNDLFRVVEYVAESNLQEALKLLDNIDVKVSELGTLPERCRVIPELKEIGITSYRELVFSRWRIVYQILEQKVVVHAVLDSRRNLEDILLDRFT